jgi:glycosyltransferase involved in cell wall biosynthesis
MTGAAARAALHFACPGPIGQPTGGYRYDAEILRGLRAAGRDVVLHELAGCFPDVDRAAVQAARDCATAARGAVLVIDGLALPGFAGSLPATETRIVALIHHPLALETGIPAMLRRRFAALEPELVRACAGVIVTSPATVPAIRAMGVSAERIRVVVPAVARNGASSWRRNGGRVRMLCVASLTPRKGHRGLLAALARLRGLAWRIDLVGPRQYDRREAGRIATAIGSRGLRGRVRLTGAVSAARVAAAYRAADLFVLPSFHEGYGMAFAEAIVAGLPVVGARAGAVPSTVPPRAGVLVRPGDPASLARALRPLVASRAARARLARGALLHARSLPDWPAQARRFAAAIDALTTP